MLEALSFILRRGIFKDIEKGKKETREKHKFILGIKDRNELKIKDYKFLSATNKFYSQFKTIFPLIFLKIYSSCFLNCSIFFYSCNYILFVVRILPILH